MNKSIPLQVASTAASNKEATIIGPDEFSVTYGMATNNAKEKEPASAFALSSQIGLTLFR